jgi:hypothetical protein
MTRYIEDRGRLDCELLPLLSLHSGHLYCEFEKVQALAEVLMGRPVFVHEFPTIHGELQALCAPFLKDALGHVGEGIMHLEAE